MDDGPPRYPFARKAGTRLPAMLSSLVGQPPTQVRLWDDTPAWLVTSHRAARAVLRDRRCSADVTRPGYPILAPGRTALTGRPTFLRMDDPAHARLRRMVLPYFTARRIAVLTPALHRLADHLVHKLAAMGPPADVVTTLADELPAHVISVMLGIPEPDTPFITAVTEVLGSHEATPHAKDDAARRLLAYLRQHIAGRRRPDGMVGQLIADHLTTGHLNHDELADILRLLVTAGHETTAGMLSLALLTIVQDPAWRDRLTAHPEAVPAAVEELLRWHTVVHTGVTRVTLDTITVDDITIPGGHGVIVSLLAANHDPTVFTEPHRLTLDRPAGQHLAFGAGTHQCLGQVLARAELSVALTAILERLPTLRIADPSMPLTFTPHAGIYRVRSLPLTW